MTPHRFVIYASVAGLAAVQLAPADARANIDDLPASALSQLFSGTVSSSASSTLVIINPMMANTIEGEDFPVAPYRLHRPAANGLVTYPMDGNTLAIVYCNADPVLTLTQRST